MNTNKILSGVAQSASYNIILQVFFRIQTFVLNGFILRFISKDVLGIINVRIFLLYSTITFLSSEAFKNACLRNPNHKQWPQVINLIWLSIPTCILCSVVLGYLWLTILEQPEDPWKQQYFFAVVVVQLCCVFERLVEPLNVVACAFLFNRLRVFVQCISTALQCIVLATFVYFKPEYAIFGFCIGQIFRSVSWVAIFYLYFLNYLRKNSIGEITSITGFFPRRIANKPSFPPEHAKLTLSFLKQGILKQILTEGERYLMTLFNILNFGDQGVYDVISNLGSLAARFLFRPIEESGYQFFAQTIERTKPLKKQNPASVAMGAKVLQHLFQLMFLLGCIIVAFGLPYSYLLLQIYGGNVLVAGSGPNLMRWHCIYILFMAVNGVAECYTFATMRKSDIDRLNYVLLVLSATFLCLSWCLTKLFSGVGFVLANCANMSFRIFYSTSFIMKTFSTTVHRPLQGFLPHPGTAIAIFLSFCITSLSEVLYCCHHGIIYAALHIAIGAACFLCVIVIVYLLEKDLVNFLKDIWHKRGRNDTDVDILDKLD